MADRINAMVKVLNAKKFILIRPIYMAVESLANKILTIVSTKKVCFHCRARSYTERGTIPDSEVDERQIKTLYNNHSHLELGACG